MKQDKHLEKCCDVQTHFVENLPDCRTLYHFLKIKKKKPSSTVELGVLGNANCLDDGGVRVNALRRDVMETDTVAVSGGRAGRVCDALVGVCAEPLQRTSPVWSRSCGGKLLEFIPQSVRVVMHGPRTGDSRQPCAERHVGATLSGRDACHVEDGGARGLAANEASN